MVKPHQKLQGIYSAIVSPTNPDESINYAALGTVVRLQVSRGVEGFYCCGSTGEGLLLSLDERKKILETILNETGGAVPVIAHTGTIRTKDAIDLARHAEIAGAAAVSLIPPYYYKFSFPEISTYYQDVVDAIDGNVIIYNIPSFTGVNFTKKNSSSLLANQRIIGIKHTSMNLYDLERIGQAFPEKILFNGHDEQFLYALSAGANSAIGTTIGLFPEIFKKIRASYQSGDLSTAVEYQTKVNRTVESFVDIGIFQAAKYAYSVLGIDCGECRKPFMALTVDQKKTVEITVKAISS